MAVPNLLSRLSTYCVRHGPGATIRRGALAVNRALFSNRSVLFYCDLPGRTAPPAASSGTPEVERLTSLADLRPQDLRRILDIWNPTLAHRNITERFGRGAQMWLIRIEGNLAGYGWTLQGSTIEPHYFPLGRQDVHLFDFFVLPEYRGRGLNPLLVHYMLRSLALEGAARAFIDTAEWNKPQLASLGKTPFICFGRARKWTILGRTFVSWPLTLAPAAQTGVCASLPPNRTMR